MNLRSWFPQITHMSRVALALSHTDSIEDKEMLPARPSRLRSPRSILLCYVSCILLCLCLALSAHAEKQVKLVLHWYPQAQFAGYYMAVEKGFYSSRGLDVQILPGGADIGPFDWLEQGKADFALGFLSTAIQRRDAGLDVVHVGQVVHDSALMLIAHKKSGIRSLADLAGTRVGVWGTDFQIQPRALFKQQNIRATIIQQAPSMDLFMRGGLDVVSAMWYNEYHTLMSYGLEQSEMTTFFFRDLGLNFPEDGLYCRRSAHMTPQTIDAMRKGTAEGWDYVFAHPDEALELVLRVMKANKVRANRSHQRWMLARMRDIILTGGRKNTDLTLSEKAFGQASQVLLAGGFIRAILPYEDFIWQDRP